MIRFLVAVSARVYGVLLWRFPKELRDRYGREMVELFELDLKERAGARGPMGVLDGWWRALRDLIRPTPPAPSKAPADSRRSGPGRQAITGWTEDFRFALRSVRRDPRFVATVILVLGASIALNTAVFSVVNAYLLRPLPYPEPERLVNIRSPVDLIEADADGLLEKRVGWDLDAFTLLGDQGPELALGAWVTPDFLEVYGVEPALGRIFTPDEAVPGSASVTLISYGLWQGRFGGDRDVLGRAIQAYTSDRPDDAETFTIVGVLPADFWHFNTYTEMIAPLSADRTLYAGRLVAGLLPERAAQVLTERVRSRVPALPPDFAVRVRKTHDDYVESIRPTLLALQSAVLLVFLIACANLAVLLLVRSARQERELSVRRALGATQARLGRQLILEGLILAALAGGIGVASGWLLLRTMARLTALNIWDGVPGGVAALTVDGHVLVMTMGLCIVTGVIFGLLPLMSAGHRQLTQSLAEGGRGRSDTVGRRRARGVMVGAEVALSLALLTSAALLVQSAVNLQDQDLGFDPDGVLSGEIGLRQASYPTSQARVDLFEALSTQVEALPSVAAFGLVNAAPFAGRFGPTGLEAESGTVTTGFAFTADAGYFNAMGIGLLRGRGFTRDDVYGAPRVAVVSATLAAALWPGTDPIGELIRTGPRQLRTDTPDAEPWSTVIGVVADVTKSVADPDAGDLYLAFAQVPPLWMNAVVRKRGQATHVTSEVEAVLGRLDPNVPFSWDGELQDLVRRATGPSRTLAGLFTTFAALALVLALVGLYGVMAYAVRQSRKEVAIRMALGADASTVRRWFLRQAMWVLFVGLAVGLGIARALASRLADQLYGIEPGDPLTMLGITGLLGATALVAIWHPVGQATTIEPMVALRKE